MAGKPYNLHRKVKIHVELHVQDDGAFLNEFSSQPTPGQSGSKSDTDIESDIDVLVNGSSSDSDHDSVTSKHRANAQRPTSGPLSNTGGQKFKKKVRLITKVPNQCYISMTTLVLLLNTMKQKWCFIGIFVVLVLHRMAGSVLIVPVIVKNL